MTDIKRKKLKIKNNMNEKRNIKSITMNVKRDDFVQDNKFNYKLPFLEDDSLVDTIPSPMALMKRFFTDDEIKFLSGEYDMIENPDVMCEGLGLDLNTDYTLEEINVRLSEKMRTILLKENL